MSSCLERCYGNASLRKCLKKGNLSKVVYLSCSEISERNAEIPQNPVFEGFPLYFVAFPKIFDIFNVAIFLKNVFIFKDRTLKKNNIERTRISRWFGREHEENVVRTIDWCGWPSSPLPSVLFPGLVLKPFPCCDNGSKQLSRVKVDYREIQSLIN